jgi:hypothetical protein
LRLAGDFVINPVGDVYLPFHTGEVDPRLLAFAGRPAVARMFRQNLPGKREFHGPAPILVIRIVESTVDMDGAF